MAEVESHSNGKHSLEDNESPVKNKLLKTENGKQINGNSNGVNKENTVSDLVDANEEENSTSAATVGGDSSNLAKEQSNSTSNNKYESDGEEDLTANTSSNDAPSRIVGEDTSESSLGVLGNSNSNGRNVKGRGIKHAEEDDDEDDDDDNEDDDDDDDEEEGGIQGEVDDDEDDVEGVEDDDDDDGDDDDDDDDGGDDDDDEDDGEEGDE